MRQTPIPIPSSIHASARIKAIGADARLRRGKDDRNKCNLPANPSRTGAVATYIRQKQMRQMRPMQSAAHQSP